jgi:protein-S-isoprenylcysteine O-methyltransferase Ste14
MWEYLSQHFRPNPGPWWALVLLFEALLIGPWLAEYFLLRRIRERTGDPIGGRTRDRRYVLVWVIYFLLLQIALYRSRHWLVVLPHTWAFPIAGSLLALAGVAIRLHAIRWLGQNFSYVVTVGEEHRLVTSGPYRLVRHPAYTGLILYFAGVALTLGDLWMLIIIVGGVAIAVTRRVRREERWLAEEFGAEYEEYRKRTRRFVPHLV